MSIKATATEAKNNMLALLDRVEQGEQVEISRHGRLIARIVPARGALAAEGALTGVAYSNATEDQLFSTGQTWEAS